MTRSILEDLNLGVARHCVGHEFNVPAAGYNVHWHFDPELKRKKFIYIGESLE